MEHPRNAFHPGGELSCERYNLDMRYEIPFTRIFYKYVPPRPLEEIDKELEAKVAKILTLLKAVEA